MTVYFLTQLSRNETVVIKHKLHDEDIVLLDYVPWPHESDGTEEDIFRITAENLRTTRSSCKIFIDARSTRDKTAIVAMVEVCEFGQDGSTVLKVKEVSYGKVKASEAVITWCGLDAYVTTMEEVCYGNKLEGENKPVVLKNAEP